MYNYLGVIRKSTAVDHCASCHFFDSKIPNLILSKNNRIEFYNFNQEAISPNKYINIYGKIKILLTIPNHQSNNTISINNINDSRDNLFVLSSDLDFCLFSYNKSNNNIDAPICGSIKEDLGQIQDNILYSFDSNKNYLLICAYKNIFKIICVNNNMRANDKYNNYTIRFQYEKILFLAPFYYDKDKNNDKNKDNNILTFVAIKRDYIETDDLVSKISKLNPNIILETFKIKIDPSSFEPPHFLYKPKIVSNGKCMNIFINSQRRKQLHSLKSSDNNDPNDIANKNKEKNIRNKNNIINTYNENNNNMKNKENKTVGYNSEKLNESVNFLELLSCEDSENISLMITNPNGLIVIFFSKYLVYYKYDSNYSNLTSSKPIKYEKRKFIDYVIVDEKNFKYYVIDEDGEIFLFGLLSKHNSNIGITLQVLGKVNNCSCLAYLGNNILFIGSSKCNSQLIKIKETIEKDENYERIEILEEYESLSPISNMALINNTQEENGIEILTVSGVGKNCAIKNIKKGTTILFSGDIDVKNIIKVFKINICNSLANKKGSKIKNNINICSFIVTTTMKSFILNYDYKYKIVSLNKSIIFEKNELVKYAKNIKSLIIIVTNLSIHLYKNDSSLILAKKYPINEINKNNNYIKETISLPLIIKFNRNLNGLFIFYNNNSLIKYEIDETDCQIIKNEIILHNISISSFDICKYFMLFSIWDSNKLGIYSFASKKLNYITNIYHSLIFTYISSIQIIKINNEYSIFLSLSLGKMIYMKLKNEINDIKNEFVSEDFFIKRNYNLNIENFRIFKIKKKNQKFLFLDTSLPCFIFFNNNNLVISNFNANHCKDIIVLDNEDNNFLFVFNNKISFGSFSNNQNQNIYTLKSGKTINNIKLIDFGTEEKNNSLNKYKSLKYLLTIEEEIHDFAQNCILTSLVLNDINMKEISRFNFEYDNEISMTLVEINLSQNDEMGKRYFVIGTGITDTRKSEPNIGHIYLMEININNNFSIKKLSEIELKGGIYKVDVYQNIIYVGIKNTLYIYSLKKKNIENFYEFKLLRHCSDFTLINDIYVLKDKITKKEDYKVKKTNMDLEKDKDILVNEIFICDLYKSIVLYKYDITNDKLMEYGREYNLTWIYSIMQFGNNFTYLTDIDDNIIALENIEQTKDKKNKLILDRKSFFNYGERINVLISTEINNKDLYSLTNNNNNEDAIEIYNNKNIKKNESIKITYFGTFEGSIGYIINLNKEIYEFLYILQEVLIKKISNNGGFNYKRWRSFKDGFISIESKGFIEGEIIGEFLNYDDDYKKIIVKEMNYPWKMSINEIVHIIETLNNFY